MNLKNAVSAKLPGMEADMVTHKEAKKMAKKINAIKYIECSALKQRGHIDVLSESVKAVIVKSKKQGKCVIL